ncbi:MAG: 2,5-dihydroxypyridine 5,6-dioxygenase [Candidatus Tectomicrobia bacterium]|nr:2,5-dihydroxypyridine 5,6-dioxygenase [Candidatus Tectomicrobia bacterium]
MNQEQLHRLFQAEFELCRMRLEESVVVVAGPRSNPAYVEASLTAAQALGARVFQVVLPEGGGALPGRPLAHLPLVVETLKRADMVIDHHFILHSPEQVEILQAGARMLLILEPPEILSRLFPTPRQRRRVEQGAELLRQAKELRLASEAGTDFRAAITQYPVITQYGYTDQPGRWDHWPSTFLYTWPNEGDAEGTVVLDTGDLVWPLRRYLAHPVSLRIEKGYLRAIEGGPDAELLDAYLRSWNDPEGYAVSHLGWGLDERAVWNALNLEPTTRGMDSRSFLGNFQFSTGPNTDAGGSRHTPCHLDMPMRRCSLWLDGCQVLDAGRLVIDEAQPSRRDAS